MTFNISLSTDEIIPDWAWNREGMWFIHKPTHRRLAWEVIASKLKFIGGEVYYGDLIEALREHGEDFLEEQKHA